MRVPGGGASCLGVGRLGSGAVPPPTARPLGGLPGPTIHWLWVRGGAGVGTHHQPHSARSCVLWGRHEGARGGRLLPGCGASGVGRSPIPQCPPSGRAAGAHYPPAVGARGCGRGDPSPTPQRALLRGPFRALWGRHEGARGGRLLPGCGASGVGRPPTPDCPPSGRAPRAHYPLAVRTGGAGVGTRHRPHSALSCVLWGRHEGARGAAPLAWVWGVWGRALYHPRLPALWAGCRGPLPTGCGCGGCGRGDPSPTPQRALLRAGFACCGGGMGVPGGGASCLGGQRPGSGALPPPTARPLGELPGPTTHWLWVRGGAGVGTRHQPHSARTCVLALRAVEAARGRPGGAPPAWVWGVRSRALSLPRLPALWAGCRGPLPTCCGCGGVRAWGPVTNPTARALACCGGGVRVPGGGASCLGVGRPGSGALPPPTVRPLVGLPGPTTHWLWVLGGAGVGTRDQPHSARSCELRGRHEGARGGRLLPGCGASRVGRSPTPDCPPSGRAAGAHYPLAVGAGGCGRGDPSPTPQRALLRAGFARCGGDMRVPGGGASCLGVGRPGSGALPPPTARPLGGLPGPITHWLWVREGAGVGTRHQPHSARSCVLWGRHEGARGGRLLPGYGASGVGCSPTPNCPPSGRAAGAHYPLPLGAGGGAGVGTCHQPHSARFCELALRAAGAAWGCVTYHDLTLTLRSQIPQAAPCRTTL